MKIIKMDGMRGVAVTERGIGRGIHARLFLCGLPFQEGSAAGWPVTLVEDRILGWHGGAAAPDLSGVREWHPPAADSVGKGLCGIFPEPYFIKHKTDPIMNLIARPFIASFAFTDSTVAPVTNDLSTEDLLYRTRGGEGASILWILGHLYEYRRLALGSMGVETTDDYENLFKSASATDGTGYPTLEKLLAQWEELSVRLEETLANQSDDAFLPTEGEPTRLYKMMTFYTWHEASHMGSINAIRKELGYPSMAEIVKARMKKAVQEKEEAKEV